MFLIEQTYEDVDGNKVSGTFYFHLSKEDAIMMIAEAESADGTTDIVKKFEGIVATNNPVLIINTFKDLILRAYGIRSEDGLRHIKSPKISEEFAQTDAYDRIFFKLVTEAEFASNFVNQCFPADMLAELKTQQDLARKLTTRPVEDVPLPEEIAQSRNSDVVLSEPESESIYMETEPEKMTYEELVAYTRANMNK